MLLFILLLAAPRTFVIDATASRLSAHVGKTGMASFAGHEHEVVAQKFQGEVMLDAENLSQSSVDLVVDASALKVAEQGEPEGDAPKVQQAMRSPDVLDVGRFTTLHFGTLSAAGKQTAPGTYDFTVSGEFSLHGV